MKKIVIISVTLLSIFLLVMVPNISAFEYNQVKEIKESLFKNHVNNFKQKIKNFDIKTLNFLSNFSNKKEFNRIINNRSSIHKFYKSTEFFDDPGNGTDENGPDDVRDYLYLLLFIITSPAMIPLLIVDSILIIAIAIISFFLICYVLLYLIILFICLPLIIYLAINDPEELKEFYHKLDVLNIYELIFEWECPINEDKINQVIFALILPIVILHEVGDYGDYDGDGR